MRIFFLLFLCVPCSAQQLPDMPAPKPAAAVHQFWDRPAKIAAGSTVALLAADSATTCNALANGRHEDWGPQSCRDVVLFMSAYRVGFWAGAYLAHRRHWHKLERLFEWAGPAVNAAGLAYSRTNGGL